MCGPLVWLSSLPSWAVPAGSRELPGAAEDCNFDVVLVAHGYRDDREVWIRPVTQTGREVGNAFIEDERHRVGRSGDHRDQGAALSGRIAVRPARGPGMAVELTLESDATDHARIGSIETQ